MKKKKSICVQKLKGKKVFEKKKNKTEFQDTDNIYSEKK